MKKYYPFNIIESSGSYIIQVETESVDILMKYMPLFNKFGYSGNGYCWEGHITQILEKTNPILLKEIEFDPEAGALFAFCKSEKSQLAFVETLSPIFSDLIVLEGYIEKADHERIDD